MVDAQDWLLICLVSSTKQGVPDQGNPATGPAEPSPTSLLALVAFVHLQLHQSSNAGRAEGAVPASSANVISIWGGARETIALKSDGTVWTWGLNGCGNLGTGNCGKLGDGTEISRSIPIQVHGPGDVGYLTSITAIM